MKLDGAVALVTGGASGLGLATTKRFLEAGAKVVMVDLNEQVGTEAAASLGDNAHFVAADVQNEEQVQAAVDKATSLGDLRVVVNCAGVATPGKLVGKKGALPLDQLKLVIGVNLVGTLSLIHI